MKLSSSHQLTSKDEVFSQKGGDAHPIACCENTGRKVSEICPDGQRK